MRISDWSSDVCSSDLDRLSFAVTGGETIPLATGWRYAIGGIRAMPPRAPWDANAGIGVMHNRMIAPIGPLALAGAARYQGESDVGIPGHPDLLAAPVSRRPAPFRPATAAPGGPAPHFGP